MNTKYHFICMVLYIFPPALIPSFSFLLFKEIKTG